MTNTNDTPDAPQKVQIALNLTPAAAAALRQRAARYGETAGSEARRLVTNALIEEGDLVTIQVAEQDEPVAEFVG